MSFESVSISGKSLSTLNSPPSTLHLQLSTLHSPPSTLHPQLSTLNSHLSTLHSQSRLPYRLHNHPYLYRHVHTAAGIGAGGVDALAQMGIVVYPALQFAVGHLGVERREIALRQFGAPVGADGEVVHSFILFYGGKDTENQ